MSPASPSKRLNLPLSAMDPRRSLMAGIVWLVIALTATFSIAASLWVGGVARENVFEQHVRRLALETDQRASDLSQAVSARLDAVRAAQDDLRTGASFDAARALREMFERLRAAYPDLDWIGLADSAGIMVAAGGGFHEGDRVAGETWFSQGLRGPWIGIIDAPADSRGTTPAVPAVDPRSFGDLAVPIRDSGGSAVGVIAAHLRWRWAGEAPDARDIARALVLDRQDVVLVGPSGLRNRKWPGVILSVAAAGEGGISAPRFERLPSGWTGITARAPVTIASGLPALGWQVQLNEPNEQVYRRANALALRIVWISICLGAGTALIGALAARRLTERLKQLTRSAVAVGRNESARIEVPKGVDEVAQLAAAFAKTLDDLQRERSDLRALSSELERRVAVRTHEVERLAEESRYAATVRERLNIARDLHDTLAHSMMAMLSEIRLLRKLQAHDPAALTGELARAEQVAHDGLNEARTAIAQMRLNAVRDTGLGAALSKAVERFADRTAIEATFQADPQAARFGDERAESIFRMAEEALRNIERHAMASRVTVALRTVGGTHVELQIDDNGVGFDVRANHSGHFGLVGLRELAQLIGADLEIQSTRGEGTMLRLSLRMIPEML
ncbi:MAG: histidine kinase [Steroidobacteraceae bacterium]